VLQMPSNKNSPFKIINIHTHIRLSNLKTFIQSRTGPTTSAQMSSKPTEALKEIRM